MVKMRKAVSESRTGRFRTAFFPRTDMEKRRRKQAGNFYVLHKTCQHVLFGVTSCILLFCSMASPCISHVNCSGVISRASDAVLGH